MVRILMVVVAGLSAPVLLAFSGIASSDPDASFTIFEPVSTPAQQTSEGAPVQAEASPSALLPHESNFEYTLRPGDSPWVIAQVFGVEVERLVEVNGLSGVLVHPGQRLTIPLVPAERPFEHADPDTEAVLRQMEAEYDLPHGLLLALAWRESNWRQHAVSSAGAIGITQIMPSTADWAHEVLFEHELNWRESTYDNARMGAAYLAFLLERADGDVWLAVAAYYQGWNGVHTKGAYAETESYVRSVLGLVASFQ